MAKLYGQVKGQAKSVASRRGSCASHIKASVQSYDGSVIMEMYYVGDDPQIMVMHNEKSGFDGEVLFDGKLDDFVSMFNGKG